MAQPGKVVSAQKQSARSNVEIARATKQARGLEVDAELLELRAKNARLTSDNSALKTEIEELKVQNGLKAQHAAQVAALTAQNTIQQSQIAKQTGMYGARVLISILSLSSRVFLVSARFLLSPTPSCVCLIFF